jgi:hypothetical protein
MWRLAVLGFFTLFIVIQSCTKPLPPLDSNPPQCDTCSTPVAEYCPDNGRSGYFPNTPGSWWAYEVIKGSSLNRDTTGVRDTITAWAETTRVVNDSTWIIRYYGGPYNGYEDTFFVFIRGDSVILNIKYNFKPPTDTTVIPIDLKAPFGIYPLIYPLRWDTPWDTLPPANYIGGPQADTIAYKLHAEVLNDTIAIMGMCAQKVKYELNVKVVYTDGLGSGATLTLPSYFFWIPYKGIGRRLEIDLRDTTGGFPTKWLQKELKGYFIQP